MSRRKTPRERLQDLLCAFGYAVSVDSLWPTKGYWAHAHQDCYRWEGRVLGKPDADGHRHTVSLYSWCSMTDCARFGITVRKDADSKGDWCREATCKRCDTAPIGVDSEPELP